MATRAYIGIKNEDGTVTAIYNHNSGGLDDLGKVLKKYFKDEEQVRELINGGSVSGVYTPDNYEEYKSFSIFDDESRWTHLTKSACKVYKMSDPEVETADSVEDYIGSFAYGMIAYAYLYIPESRKWHYVRNSGTKLCIVR